MSEPQPKQNIAILLLAAGSSSRLGRSKQLLPINGQPLLLKSVRAAVESGIKNIVVVLGANAVAHRKLIDNMGVKIVENSNWNKGMGSSLKLGLIELLEGVPNSDAVVTMVCDQPLITPVQLQKLVAAYEETHCAIVASAYQGVVGVPALFHQSLFHELLSVADDAGAKKMLQQHADLVKTIEFPGGEIDIDTEDDLKYFLLR